MAHAQHLETLTIAEVIASYTPLQPTRKWYSVLPKMVRLVGDKRWRRLRAYSVGNSATIFIVWRGGFYALQSSFGPDVGDTFAPWIVH